MKKKNRLILDNELVLAGLTVAAITLVYLIVVIIDDLPAASGLVGHSIGILGFALMIATETLYSIRKRSRKRPVGRMSDWLKFHIYTGIVGPYLVFLHTAWKFQGLAGVTMLLTAVVVLSGFFGRYIYTAVPRTAQGVIVERQILEDQIQQAEAQLNQTLSQRGLQALQPNRSTPSGIWAVLLRGITETQERLQEWAHMRRLTPAERKRTSEIAQLVRRRRQLQRQISSLSAARRLLAIWHALHVPIGMTLFLFAFIHAAAALYYASLLK